MYSYLLLALLAISLSVTTTVHAEEGTQENLVGILSIDTGGVSGTTAEQFETQVEEALEGVGRRLVRRKALRDRLQGSGYLEGCYFGPCLTVLRVASGVPLALVARFQGEGSSYSFVITLVDTKTGLPTAQVAQTCPVCTVDEAITTATLATIKLLNGGEDIVVATSAIKGTLPIETNVTQPTSNKPLRIAGWLFLSTGVVAGLAGGYLWQQEEHNLARMGFTAGFSLFSGGATMLLLSDKF